MSNHIQPTSLNQSKHDNHAIPAPLQAPVLDASDRDFLKLLNNLGVGKASANTPVSPPPVPLDDPLAVLTKTAETAEVETTDTTEAPEAKSSKETQTIRAAKVRLENEIDLLKADISLTDMVTLQQVANAAIQAPQGIPIQTLFQQDNNGVVRFNGAAISERLAALVKKAHQTGQPIRVEVDPKTSIVLRIKNGRVSAEFLTSDAAAAMHIKQHMDSLRNRIQSENLPVDTLTYRYEDRQQQSEPQNNESDTEA